MKNVVYFLDCRAQTVPNMISICSPDSLPITITFHSSDGFSFMDQTTSHYDEPYQAFEYLLRKQKYFSIVGRKTWFLSSLRFKAMSNM